MKIAFIYLGRRGGGAALSYELAVHLARRIQMLAVISTYVENDRLWQASGLELCQTETYRNLVQAVWGWISPVKMRALAVQIRAWEPDVLLFPMFYTWNPLLQRLLPEIPSIVAVHDPTPHPGLVDRVYSWLENASLRRARRCLAFSRSECPALVQRGVTADKIDIIPLGEFSSYREAAILQLDQPRPKPPILLFFGRITAYKGLDVLLQAFQQIHQQQEARLVIAGDGDIRPYLPLLKGTPDVELINRWIADDEISALFQRASLVILPYTSASQSGVIPIAAAFRLPVIASRVGGIPEQIEDGKTGLLVEPGSVAQLATAMGRLLGNPELSYQLGHSLGEDYQKNRNWDQIAEAVRQVCEKALAG